MLTKEVHFSLWYCIISKDGIREETKKEKKLSAEDLLLNNGLATYKVYELISNTKYQFELAVINKRLGIEGEHVELIASTGKTYVHTCIHTCMQMYVLHIRMHLYIQGHIYLKLFSLAHNVYVYVHACIR